MANDQATKFISDAVRQIENAKKALGWLNGHGILGKKDMHSGVELRIGPGSGLDGFQEANRFIQQAMEEQFNEIIAQAIKDARQSEADGAAIIKHWQEKL